ncbi:hypothetical protein ABIB40_004050 [Pedobacter sp. UYP30]
MVASRMVGTSSRRTTILLVFGFFKDDLLQKPVLRALSFFYILVES